MSEITASEQIRLDIIKKVNYDSKTRKAIQEATEALALFDTAAEKVS